MNNKTAKLEANKPKYSRVLNKNKNKSTAIKLGFLVKEGGALSLLQDLGRNGLFNLGLTNGGPADPLAFYWANRLCGNRLNSTAIEVNLGGLALIAQVDSVIAITGAPMPLTINGKPKELWRSHYVYAGDTIKLGYSASGVRCYVAVVNGFDIKPSFGSTATVCREALGGLNGGKLLRNDILACDKQVNANVELLMLPKHAQPQYKHEVVLRTILGYQQQHFSSEAQKILFSSQYQVSKNWDRMGYRLQGEKINADIDGILSEGICYGAIQVPADGQPIVLLNDRQTIGGYPKIGSVISQDCAKLSQLRAGDKVSFELISMADGEHIFHEAIKKTEATNLVTCRSD